MANSGILKVVVLGGAILGLGVFAFWRNAAQHPRTALEEIVVPQLSAEAKAGEIAFNANCAACHGPNGAGTDQGPPLIHDIYNPGHHADMSFHIAVQNGVPQHHWPFGNMPAQPQVSREDVDRIIAYVRELQAANGIHFQKHQM